MPNDHPMPQQGGSFVRQPDGTLIPADAAAPAPEPEVEADKPAPTPLRGKAAADKE